MPKSMSKLVLYTRSDNGGRTHLVAQLRDKLLVARQDVRAVLDETAEGPEPEWRLAVLLDDVQVRVVHAAPHLARFLDHRVQPLREWVVELGERRLHATQ